MIRWQNRVSGLLAVVLLASVFKVQSKDDDDKKKESVGTVIGIDLGTTYSWLVVFIVKLQLAISQRQYVWTSYYFTLNILFCHTQ